MAPGWEGCPPEAGPGAATHSGLEPSAAGTRAYLSSFLPSQCRSREPSGQRGLACHLNQGQEVHQQGKWVLAMAGRQVLGRGSHRPLVPESWGRAVPEEMEKAQGRLSRQPYPRAWGHRGSALEDESGRRVPRVRMSLSLLLVRVLQKGSQRDIYRSTGGDLL